ncbi:MAG TPA: hypothetical protein VMH91_04190 [Candidatus Paceibacterota bacterium]|nr:hypothetical protein [Candidatus Paceibacterota bacterium]
MKESRKRRRRSGIFKRPTLELLVTSLEVEKKMPADTRHSVAAMLFSDFHKMGKKLQDRFAAIMNRGTPDERRRIGSLIERK